MKETLLNYYAHTKRNHQLKKLPRYKLTDGDTIIEADTLAEILLQEADDEIQERRVDRAFGGDSSVLDRQHKKRMTPMRVIVRAFEEMCDP